MGASSGAVFDELMNNTAHETCFIGLGSNLAKPRLQLENAVEALSKLPECHVLQVSSFYLSQPMGPKDQPDYVNGVVKMTSGLSPLCLLDQLQGIENKQGRERRGVQWGPRTLDLDLLIFGQLTMQTPRLTIPHYGMAERCFVLYPLADLVAGSFIIPGLGSLELLLEQCPREGLVRLV